MSEEINITSSRKPSTLGKLKNDWAAFLGVLFSPIILFLIVANVGFVALLLANPTISPPIEAFITVVIALVAGLTGAMIDRRWNEINESSILVTRGKSAIRGLKLLSNNITSLQKRVGIYLSRMGELSENNITISMTYEEIIGQCQQLLREALNAIEEWQDIIPEVANIYSKIEFINEMQDNKDTLEKRIESLNSELEKTKEQTSEERTKLLGELSSAKSELKETKIALRNEQSKLNFSGLGGMGTTVLSAPSNFEPSGYSPFDWTCENCGKTSLSFLNNNTCPSCGHKNLPRLYIAGKDT